MPSDVKDVGMVSRQLQAESGIISNGQASTSTLVIDTLGIKLLHSNNSFIAFIKMMNSGTDTDGANTGSYACFNMVIIYFLSYEWNKIPSVCGNFEFSYQG